MVKRKTKAQAGVQITGRSVAYMQTVSKSGKPGKARPVILTTVAAAAPVAVTPAVKRKAKRK